MPVWNKTAFHKSDVNPSSLLIAPIAPKHGAEKRLNTIKAYADAGVKNWKIWLLNINVPVLTSFEKFAMIAIEETTCSLATNPWIAETEAAHDNSPKNG